ncbi:MAG TPA: pilus assembly PilX N-terminal domain-containing protein [Gemmatimonadales bacterium]|jgi:hypothetical protein|nr:pilus assembly PilX N-terminal domain-containing protein [Gemmatimonadales bacterium]
MKRVMQDERGIALAVAIFALVIVGALVAGAFFAGTQEQRVADNTRRLGQSFGVAEVGIGRQVARWDPARNNAVAKYPAATLVVPDSSTATGVFGGQVLKLNGNLYLIDIIARDSASRSGRLNSRGGARQRIGLLVRIQPLQMDIRASLTTQGGANLTGNASVDGRDHVPVGWTDCEGGLDTSRAGIRNDAGTVSTSGNATVAGTPPVMNDTSVSDKTFTQYGDVTYDQLATRANVVLPGGTYRTEPTLRADGSCDKGNLTNWGDGINRTAPCGNYFPVIHVTGSVTLNGVQGQGILLVDGDLEVQGDYQFYGVTIVRGRLKTAGGGSTDAHFWGAVMAENVDIEFQNLSGSATLNYSKCAITQALQMTGTVAPMVSRGWAQLF